MRWNRSRPHEPQTIITDFDDPAIDGPSMTRAIPASELTGEGMKMLRRSEKQEESEGDKLMALYGFRSIHFSQARASNQTPGIPDRRYVHRARRLAVWWEAKRVGGTQSEAQREFQSDCEAVGEHYVCGPMMALRDWIVYRIKSDVVSARPKALPESPDPDACDCLQCARR